ncbi:lipopolysaccharide biosynthesis protein [Peribacillus frigoritolerans]|uniref:lipopolysaccharide biosynthesis protein n=1 Tax=Peribacillus frigoritolerans TaxID=450367 RepID=UPI00207ACE62|nr:oligosaccharide flippase family protein [Peribacillus frigoritolerans]USK63481.1 oligosaccharide flippase family protein [Peribacillus frigoritolerans]
MNLKNYIKKSKWSGIISLGLGTIIAQSITILIQPILTRLITPEELGIYTFIISMATLIIPVAALKLEMLIVIEENDENAELLTDVGIIAVIFTTLIYTLFILVMLCIGNNSFEEIGLYSLLIPFIVLTNGLRFIFISHNNREKKYSLIARISVLRELTMGIMQVLSGILGGGAGGQTLGYGLSPIFGLRIQAKEYIYRYKKRDKIKISQMLFFIKKNKNHIKFLVPAQFINSFSYALITLSVISLFSATEAGYYAITINVLGIPLVLITNNVSKVYLQKMGEDYRKGNSVWDTFLSVIKVMGSLSIIGFSVLTIIGPSLTKLVFGEGYIESGKYISILCFMFAFRFVASSIIGSYVIFNKQYLDTLFQTILVLSGIIIYFLSDLFNLSIYKYFELISIVYGIIYLLIIINIGYLCKRQNTNEINNIN